jgi:hypothetical protein
MPANPFGFLLDLTEDQGREWLKRYLRGETPDPPAPVPFDLEPVEFLLGEISPLLDPALPLRIGTLAGTLLAEAIVGGAHRAGDIREMESLFALVESLPVSEEITEFLNDLAVTGRLLRGRKEIGADLYLLALRALALHQRPVQGEIVGLVDFWKRKLDDPPYAAIAMQGLLGISVTAAINALPEFVRLARTADPPIPLANTLFAISEDLGADQLLWTKLVRAFEGRGDGLEVVRETFRRARLSDSNPEAWAALQTAPPRSILPTPFVSRYSLPDDAAIESARERLNGALLEPLAA